jgi:hypothetical protein
MEELILNCNMKVDGECKIEGYMHIFGMNWGNL